MARAWLRRIQGSLRERRKNRRLPLLSSALKGAKKGGEKDLTALRPLRKEGIN